MCQLRSIGPFLFCLFASLAVAACGSSGSSSSSTPPPGQNGNGNGAEVTLAAPENLQAQAGEGQIALQWDPVPDADGYRVYYAREAGIDPANIGAFADGDFLASDDTDAVITGLLNGATYYAVVTAVSDDPSSNESPASNEVSAQVQGDILASHPLNGTGIDWWSNGDTNFLPGPVAAYPGQDADYPGAEFSFIKLDENGEDLPDQATDWQCVRDALTGLIWEVKLDEPGHLRDRQHSYSWYQPDSNNGGAPGTVDGGECAGSDCDTAAFVEAVNSAGLCGRSDWRLPTAEELLSLVNNGISGPAFDTDYFPNTIPALAGYWTSTSTPGSITGALNILSVNGALGSIGKSTPEHVRLVTGGPEPVTGATHCGNEHDQLTATTPTLDFAIFDNGTVIHRKTGLMWMRCSLGQEWNQAEAVCSGAAAMYNWQEALQAADGLEFADQQGWRLPNKNELLSIVEWRCSNPAINEAIFPGTLAEPYWTSSPFTNNVSHARGVNFLNGTAFSYNKLDPPLPVRLVRTP